MKLSDTLEKTISDFCGNGFTNAAENHCSHFVCHVLEVDAGYDCKTHTGKKQPGSCLRVQELFDACPQVGLFADAPGIPCIAFVTAKNNVDLPGHKMRNVPQKHVGIYDGTHIYHYSNTQDKVVRQTPKDFLDRFQAVYSGDQALFFGTMPPGARLPDSEQAAGAAAPGTTPVATSPAALSQPLVQVRSVTAGGRTDYFAKVEGGAEFYVARGTRYQNYRGLHQTGSQLYGPKYSAQDFTSLYGTAAAMIGVIAAGESSGYFNRLNSYDRAAYTFGFFQLAAHTPNDNLILLFRSLAAGNQAFQRLFPDLSLREGKLHRQIDSAHFVNLEKEYARPGHPSELNLKDFMTYLNPDLSTVDDVELNVSARLVSLANNEPDFNAVQAKVAAEITMKKLRMRYEPWYNLDGQSDLICTAIADIHHQGRGTKTQVRQALAQGTVTQKLTALCNIGADSYASRCQTLRTALRTAKEAGLLGVSVFDRASGLFRPSAGWPA